MLKAVSAFLSVVSLVAVVDVAHAQCVTISDTDVVQNVTVTWVECGPRSGPQVMANCSPTTGAVMLGIYPDEFVGGDRTTAQVRGSNEESARSYTVVVVRSDTGFVFEPSSLSQVTETISGSPMLYIRYADYREVWHTVQFDVSGFAEQTTALACEAPAPVDSGTYNGDKTKN